MSDFGQLPPNSKAMKALQDFVKAHEGPSGEQVALHDPEFERGMLELMKRLKAEMRAYGRQLARERWGSDKTS